ncbi:MAG: hypothetical protein AAF682_23065 [Planctomycetota bacterium]
MQKIRNACALLLALPLIVFGGNDFVQLFELPLGDQTAGEQLLMTMREGGLMKVIASSHVLVGLFLLVPRLRFIGGLMQLPMSVGIVAFHGTMLPEGLPPAIGMLALNIGVVAERTRLGQLMGRWI